GWSVRQGNKRTWYRQQSLSEVLGVLAGQVPAKVTPPRPQKLKQVYLDRQAELRLPPGTMDQPLAQQAADALLKLIWQENGLDPQKISFGFSDRIEGSFAGDKIGIDPSRTQT